MDTLLNIFPNPYAIVFFAIFVANVLFAGYVYSKRGSSNERTIFWFSFMMLVSSGWALGQFGMSFATTAAPYGLWYSFTELAVAFLMPVYVCFVLSFVGKGKVIARFDFMAFVLGTTAALLYVYWRTDIITIHNFALAIKMPWGYEYPRGPVPWDLFVIGSYVCYMLFELFSYYAGVKDPVKKHQIGLITLAIMIPSVGGIIFQGVLPVFFKVAELPVTPPLIFLTSIIVGYTLIRYGTGVFSLTEASVDILQMIPDSLFILDPSLHIQMANPSAAKLLGVRVEELSGRTLDSFLGSDADKVFWREKIVDPLTHWREVKNVEITFPGAAGVTSPVRIHAIAHREKDKVVSIIMLLTDISVIKENEQKVLTTVQRTQEQNVLLEQNKKAMLNLLEDSRELEGELKSERDRANTIVNSMSEGLFVVDKNYRITLINPTAERIFELSGKNAVGQTLPSVTTVLKEGKVLPDAERPVMRTLTTGESMVLGLEDDYQLKSVSGRVFPASISTAALKQGDKIIGALVTFHDISKDKEVKETIEKTVDERTRELKEEQARLTASINSLELGFMLTDASGRIFSKNPALGSILNLPWGVKTLEEIDASLKASFSFTAMYNQARNEHRPVDLKNLAFEAKNIAVFAAPIYVGGRDEDFIGLVILVQDQTEAKVLERSRDEFFSIASHELRTPLTAIRGNTSLIQEHYSDKLDPELKEMVNDIYESSVRLIDIVNDFLNMGRLEQQRFTFKNEAFGMEDLISDALKEYQVTGSRQHLSLDFEKPSESLPKAFADKERIRQVVVNLIGNSLKFTENGGVKVKTKQNNGMIEVYVSDTGRGIPLQNQSLLFHKFQQAGESLFTRDTTRGTGLGLYISKLMIEAMGGKIWLVSSEEGKGSTFAFSIPVAR